MNGLVHWNLKKAIKECLKDKKKILVTYTLIWTQAKIRRNENQISLTLNFLLTYKLSEAIDLSIASPHAKKDLKKTASHFHSFIKWKCYKC